MRNRERRNLRERGAVVRCVVNDIIQKPSVTVSVESLCAWLNVPIDAAQRILMSLAASGLVREVKAGIWVRGSWPCMQPG